MIREYIKNNILVTDGAMGTYYSKITGDYNNFCEFANLNNPKVIFNIHKEYIDAGAKFIRTNTFSANTLTMDISKEELRNIITEGYKIAKKAAATKDNVFVAADVGPINKFEVGKPVEYIIEEYKFVVDTFMELGADIFVFETLSSIDCLEEIFKYIKLKNKYAFILTQFAVMQDGFTREGISANSIVNKMNSIKNIDAYGFNCGSGPAHLYSVIKNLKLLGDTISALPNSGYPELINERMVYVDNPDYFADKMSMIKNVGIKILGGCCGTTPRHIEKLVEKLKTNVKQVEIKAIKKEEKPNKKREKNKFWEKLVKDEFPIVVELDPPFNIDIDKIMYAAEVCKKNNIDLVTIADSPMSKVRVDSIMIASKIKRELGIEVMPHMCCRDKNVNAIRASLLAAHIEGIRNILAITGDPVTGIDKVNTKSVFNLNSFKLMNLISEMNKEVFKHDEINIGGALNLNVLNKKIEVSRMLKKVDNGGTFFLTQPIFEESTIEFLANLKRDKGVKIIGGILPLVSYRNVQFINNELFGVNIPKEYVERFKIDMSREEAETVGVDLATELIHKIKKYVDGIYMVTPFNRIEMVMKILKNIRK
ncbi:bifunctional homocysteine S-methyltransferase/methylenetetrahydrofolate reductase [Clostridium felsineum]|uniref:bifunctional homocysteine S-methyltransferase/methylenetetrahydrofolate reductase n=1 Tax=Clostridium felsineum TaxID=36839 RepID=UPI0009C51FF9|nr:bifunctional homocysteine S-methyltransferase/methylenetetrahydrofolate reductase [Clostridium felsineum]MCR3761917.1 bifunctional homocysteine S-methyltransferase/methylenetetrahydrofolate reductase [Clostridium felsineum]URZ18220.1 Bifunctional homocysteine S-methyltransferase/5,10-methylenetetrahydrofolate reductase [Clostridium felsineum DSM 794]